MEVMIKLSSARNWISGFNKGSASAEKQHTCEKGKNPFTGFEALSSKNCSSSSKGKAVFRGSEIEELNARLKVLEEETESMKKAFFWSLEERKVMMNEIYKQFQLLHLNCCHESRDLVIEESSSTVNPFEESESSDQYPILMSKEFRVNAVAFQELDTYRGHIKFHHD